jgi:outer membrane protein OmpA-like peptidoglycan-associated protein
MTYTIKIGALAVVAALAGCATPENRALEQARATYRTAQVNPQVTTRAPVELNEAERTLNEAERLWREGADTNAIDHQAYLAEQRANIALQTAELRSAEAAVATTSEQRNKVLLEARERELERTRSVAAQETQEAQRARQQAEQRAAELSAQTRQLQAELADLKAQQTERGWVLTLGGDVLFDVGQATLKPGAKRALDNLARFMSQHPQRNIVVEGFTDSTGSAEYNERLSERRAEAVKEALVARGVDAKRISARGYGKEFPVATNDTVAGRQLNRRVEVVISEDGKQITERRR